MPKTISQQQLINDLHNFEIPDEELARYLELDESNSTAFAPVIQPNPDLVTTDGGEAALAVGFLNKVAKWRRKKRYKKRIKNWTGTRIVSEGDSWFQYPILLKDVIDHLSDLDHYQYAIYSLGEAGDLLGDMVREDEISEALERENPQVFLISGGGNDMVGDGRMQQLVDIPGSGANDPDNYPNANFGSFLGEIERHYRHLFERVLRDFPHLKIITHGYDHAIPDNGSWLGDPLKKAGVEDEGLQADIVRVMIDRLNDRMQAIAADFGGSVRHVDARGQVGKKGWHDELHPDDNDFGKVAALFDEAIQEALAGESVSVTVPAQPSAPEVPTISNIRQLRNADYDRLVYARAKACMGDGVQVPGSRHERRQLERDLDQFFEKVHMEANFLPSSFLEQGVKRAHSVCRIVTETSLGSGFMIASRDFIMTNNHVIPNEYVASDSIAQFDYDEDNEQHEVHLDPGRLFLTDQDLDYTIVALADHDLPLEITPIELRRNPHSVTRRERVNIVQHPRGRRKEVSLHDNKVSYVYDKVIRYSADTEPGSSGSPVFNNQWELVALHHAGWATGDSSAENEGVRITAIVEHLLSGSSDESGAVTDLIPTTGGDVISGDGTSVPVQKTVHVGSGNGNKLVLELPEKFGTLRIRFDG